MLHRYDTPVGLFRWAFLWAVGFALTTTTFAAEPVSEKHKSFIQSLTQNAAATPNDQPTAVAGVRGLDEVQGQPLTTNHDYAAIDRLEKIQISAAELDKFIQEGSLR